MGKNRHSKDRLFITSTEWKNEYGGKKRPSLVKGHTLPFDHCALSLTPFTNPSCTPEGVLFEFEHLFSFVRKHKCNPVTGQPMATSEIIRLNMSKNSEKIWHCPVLYKVFNNSTHIVAIRSTGNVYSYEAVNELNLKTNNLRDLLTEEPFNRSDIITLQNVDDPQHVALRDISNFQYLQVMRDDFANSKSNDRIRNNPTAERVMKEFNQKNETNQINLTNLLNNSLTSHEFTEDVDTILTLQPTTEDVLPGHMMTNQKTSSSFTSTSLDIHTNSKLRLATPDEIRDARWRFMRQVGKKAYVQIQTNLGLLNFEIHCDSAPRTSWNFINLCLKGYYDNTIFHRLVPGFVLQGGDPTGTGTGGSSIWGKPFRDEFDSRLLHDRRGILSMANSGENTNNSQFFITLQPTPHLDLKHPIFGRLVGGGAILDLLENIGSGKDERPLQEITIITTKVFSNPIDEADSLLIQSIIESQNKRLNTTTTIIITTTATSTTSTATSTPNITMVSNRNNDGLKISRQNQNNQSTEVVESVGKYISVNNQQNLQQNNNQKLKSDAIASFMKREAEIIDEPILKKKKRAGFDNW